MHAFASALLAVVLLLAGPAAGPLAAADGWVPVGPPGGPVPYLIVHPRDPRVLWAGTPSNGVFKSVDGGASWQGANQGLTARGIRALAVAPSAPDTLYLAAGLAGIFRSTDGGATWRAVLPCQQRPFPCCGCVPLSTASQLTVHVRNPRIVFAATRRGVFKSVDGGAQWRPTGLGERSTYMIAVDPRNQDVLYAGTIAGSFRSGNGGASWAPWGDGLPSPLTRLAFDPADPRRMWAASGGLYQSTDGGAHWRLSANFPVTALAVSPGGRGGPVIVAGTPAGAFRSPDGGRTWQPARAGLLAQRVNVAVAHPGRPGTFWLGTGPNPQPFISGIYKSVNGGASWSFSSRGLFNETAVALAFDPLHPGVLWAGSPFYRVRRSPDGGATWTDRSGNLPRFEAFRVNDLEADPSDPRTIWAGTSRGVWITEDAGTTWEARNEGITPASSPGHIPVQILRVAGAAPSVAYAWTATGLFRTADQGEHWARLTTPFQPWAVVEDVLVDPRDPDVLFVAAEDLWSSRDGGGTWTELLVGDGAVTPRALAADPRNPDVLYLAGDGEVFESSDGGQSWVLAATLPLGSQADLAVAPAGEIWVSGQEGVWSSSDGLTWTLVPGVPLPVTAIEVDPHPPHAVFAATSRGFYRFAQGD